MPARGIILKSFALVGLCALALGCPDPTDQQLALLVSPSELDFGMVGDAPQTFVVRTNKSSPTLPPFTAEVSNVAKNWLKVSPGSGTSAGPSSPFTFEVRVDRTKMRAGDNVGAVTVLCQGLVPRSVTVKAKAPMAADFVADPVEIFEGEEVQFEDLSAVAAGEPVITSWVWDFGDGTPLLSLSTAEGPSHVYATPGYKTVRLTTTSTKRSDTETKEEYINVKRKVAPTAAFAVSTAQPLANAQVQFTDTSQPGTADIVSWMWDFGDGQQSTQQNPTHTYAMGGVYTVSLTVTSEHGGDIETKMGLMRVTQVAPRASFTVTAGTLLAGVQNPVTFTDTSAPGTAPITSWTWTFGDGATSAEQYPLHAYLNAGTYPVKLSVSSVHGTSSVTMSVTIESREPVADFRVSDASPLVNTAVTFTDLTDPGTAPIKSWSWNFGDNTPASTAQNPTHVYTKAGSYDVELTVKTNHGENTAAKTNYINVRKINPTPDFSADPLTQYVGQPVQFTDHSQPGTADITSWDWNFGDGSAIGHEQNPVHVYNKEGLYNITLTVKTGHGTGTITKTGYIRINPTVDPTAQFIGSPRNPYEGDTVTFTDQSSPGSAPITSWQWDFGDTATSIERNPRHIYGTPGTYTVSLTVRTKDGVNTSTRVGYIIVRPNVDPTANFVADPENPLMGDSVEFTDTSNRGTASAISSWLWNFGDAFCAPSDNVSSEQNPSHTYAEPGLYTVSLKVVTPHGQNTVTKTQYIKVRPRVDFTATPTLAGVGKEVKFTDLTNAGSGKITAWLWNFGDGFTSSAQNPSHVYGMAGTYDVTLTVTLAQGVQGALTKPGYITTEIKGPTADFTASNFFPVMYESVAFTDLSDPGSAPITNWQWTFGDNTTSSAKNPFHTYNAPGVYTVTLTVSTPFGTSQPVPKTITVGGPQPTAQFKQDKTIILRSDDPALSADPSFEDSVTFTSTSTIVGTGYISHYSWRVWQGDPNQLPTEYDWRSYSPIYKTSPENRLRRNPFHEIGNYHVALTVWATTMTNPGAPDDPSNGPNFVSHTTVKANAVEVREPSELDMYIRQLDPSYTYTLYGAPIIGNGYKAFVINLTSQSWQAPGRPAPETWKHWLTVIQPNQLQNHQTALLYLTSGIRNESAPKQVDPILANFAVQSGSVVAVLRGVPNQPFAQGPGEQALSEDRLIAASMRKFVDQSPEADPKSLALFPMVKSAVRAMDTVQRLMVTPSQSGNYPPVIVSKFVVSGGSDMGWSRGWATYLTAATDTRVTGILPMSFDAVNIYEQVQNYLYAYGAVPEGLEDYLDFDIYGMLDDPNALNHYLTIRDRRRRVERLLRQIMEEQRDDFRRDPQEGNNFDGITELRRQLQPRTEDEPDTGSWRVLSAIASAWYNYPSINALSEAYYYGAGLWNNLTTMIDEDAGAEVFVQHERMRQIAGSVYHFGTTSNPDIYDGYLYTYSLTADANDPPVTPDDIDLGEGWYLVELMRRAEEEIAQVERGAWMQYMIDPIWYNQLYTPVINFASPFGARLHMPKYILLGSGDHLSKPEGASFYFGLLNQEKHLRYYVGAGHDLGGSFEQALYDALPWYQRVVTGQPQPQFSWTFDSTGQQLTVRVQGAPIIKMWRTHNTDGDFRTVPGAPNPPEWASLELGPNAQGVVSVQLFPTLEDYTAYFVELTYPSVSGPPQVFTTDMRVIPPYEPPFKSGEQPAEGPPPTGDAEAAPEAPAP